MSNSVVYTAIFGDYDELCDPVIISPEFAYICFTDDKNLRSNKWDIRVIESQIPGDSCRSARFVKICAHKFLSDFDVSLWVDGNQKLLQVPDMHKLLGDWDFAVEAHPNRDCVYEEATACKLLKKDATDIIDMQMRYYKDLEFPEHAGLYATWMLVRRHNILKVIELSNHWWTHVRNYSKRDQLSLPCVAVNHIIHKIPSGFKSKLLLHKFHK